MTYPTPGSPPDPIERRAARVILLDAAGRLLLLRGHDPARPRHSYWFTVGGGLDEGELPAEGAARELAEETGLVVEPAALGEPVWREVTEFPFDGQSYRQVQDFFALRVPSWQVRTDGFNAIEEASIDGYLWWHIDDLVASGELFYPDELPALVRGILGG
jgi:8-oxo-dGTP pyrophosphatase MutT (NUDIX family)